MEVKTLRILFKDQLLKGSIEFDKSKVKRANFVKGSQLDVEKLLKLKCSFKITPGAIHGLTIEFEDYSVSKHSKSSSSMNIQEETDKKFIECNEHWERLNDNRRTDL